MKEANQSPRCEYIKPSGIRCGSAALRDHTLCYFHHRYRAKPHHMTLPLLEDAASIQCCLQEIMQGIYTGELETKPAGLLLYSVQIAVCNLRHVEAANEEQQTDALPKRHYAAAPPFPGKFNCEPLYIEHMRDAVERFDALPREYREACLDNLPDDGCDAPPPIVRRY